MSDDRENEDLNETIELEFYNEDDLHNLHVSIPVQSLSPQQPCSSRTNNIRSNSTMSIAPSSVNVEPPSQTVPRLDSTSSLQSPLTEIEPSALNKRGRGRPKGTTKSKTNNKKKMAKPVQQTSVNDENTPPMESTNVSTRNVKSTSKRKARKKSVPLPEVNQPEEDDIDNDQNIENINDDDQDDNYFKWNDIKRDRREFQFTGSPGVKNIPTNPTCPLEVFKTFLSENIINDIVQYTNLYANLLKLVPSVQEKMRNKKRCIENLWQEVSSDDIWLYIGIQILMGIIHKPNYHMYWTNDPVFSTPIFSQLMRRDRFEHIRKMIHFTDPSIQNDSSLSKLDTYLDALKDNFQKNYVCTQNVAVDEYLSLWKGRLHFKVYIPSKRERYGVKIYMLCESATGYLSNFIVYCGEDTSYQAPPVVLPKDFESYTNPEKVVLTLLEQYWEQGYKVILDNLYTSPDLARALFENRTDCFGTLRKKKHLPHNFWTWKPPKGVGENAQVQFSNEKYMVCRWNDPYKSKKVKIVSMLSTVHIGEIAPTGKNHFRTKEAIKKPDVVIDYNANMGGVDNLSRVIVPYCLQRKGVKWYRKIAELFVETCIYNAYIAYCKLNPTCKWTQLQYRQELVNLIIAIHKTDVTSYRVGPKPRRQNENPIRITEKHFIRMILAPEGQKRKRRRCVRCIARGKRVDTSFECQQCVVALCMQPCFPIYHSKIDYKKHYPEDLSDVDSETEEEILISEESEFDSDE